MDWNLGPPASPAWEVHPGRAVGCDEMRGAAQGYLWDRDGGAGLWVHFQP